MENRKFAELVKDCLDEEIVGKHTKVEVDGKTYYASFEFREICNKCGK